MKEYEKRGMYFYGFIWIYGFLWVSVVRLGAQNTQVTS